MRLLVAACGLSLAASEDFTDAQALLQSHVDASSAQPEYARLHVHGYEKAKDSLVNAGVQIDNILKDLKKSMNNLTYTLHVKGSNVDKKCNLTHGSADGLAMFALDNTKLGASTNGVGYRFRKALWDRDLKTVAPWGSTVQGVDHGDGWIQVGDCFLPTTVQDVPVVKLQARSKASVKLAPKPASLLELQGTPTWSADTPVVTEAPHELELVRHFEGERVADQNGVAAGDSMEIKLVIDEKLTRWANCVVQGAGEKEGTYNLFLPQAPPREREMKSVPVSMLRKPNAYSDGVLLFFAVTSNEKSMEMIKRNVDHLRKTFPGKADVFFVHIDTGKADWTDTDADWYSKNVQFSAESEKIPKQTTASASMLFAQSYYPPQIRLAKSFIPQVLKTNTYKWIWMVDEDIDFSTTDLVKLFGDADRTGAMVVGPSVKYEDKLGAKAMQKMYRPGCSKLNTMCYMHVPKPACQYRYTNFVEAMFPIMRAEAFQEMIVDCEGCESQIDRFWCARPAMRFKQDHEQVCAILDQVSVVHTNGKTLRKWEDIDNAFQTQRDPNDVQLHDYTFDIGSLKCVQ